jgi:hypothetical protein
MDGRICKTGAAALARDCVAQQGGGGGGGRRFYHGCPSDAPSCMQQQLPAMRRCREGSGATWSRAAGCVTRVNVCEVSSGSRMCTVCERQCCPSLGDDAVLAAGGDRQRGDGFGSDGWSAAWGGRGPHGEWKGLAGEGRPIAQRHVDSDAGGGASRLPRAFSEDAGGAWVRADEGVSGCGFACANVTASITLRW